MRIDTGGGKISRQVGRLAWPASRGITGGAEGKHAQKKARVTAPARAGQVLNPLARIGWARLPAGPVYHARPCGEGVWTCPARGPGQWTAGELAAWAVEVGAEVVLVDPAAAPVMGGRAG